VKVAPGWGTWFHPSVTAWNQTWDIWLIFVVLGVVVPWRGRVRLRQFLAQPNLGPRERVSLYLSTIAFQWLAVAVVAWRSWAHGFKATELGLTKPGLTAVGVALAGAMALSGFQWFNLRRVGRITDRAANLKKLARAILPQSGRELLPYLGLAVTAGICEEFLYRGFAFAVLGRAGWPNWAVVLGSSALFALAHLYQGRGGLVATLILGLVFGIGRSVYPNLLPVATWHAAVDIVAGIAGPRFLIPAGPSPVTE
jgi:uncharacterized protein